LKLQELTDGKVICKYDSFLGFRHGPRVVINEKSLIVYLFSNINHVFQYEKDLAESIATDCVYLPSISIGRKIGGLPNSVLDVEFNNLANYFYILPVAIIGQLLGFYQSLKLGLHPDNPSVSGAINRVVQGVTIYSK
jgi:tagatose-6-phosphate ketose/aldose isomerase